MKEKTKIDTFLKIDHTFKILRKRNLRMIATWVFITIAFSLTFDASA